MDSNHRSKLQQIYSLSPLATRESAHVFNYDTCIVYHNRCDYASIFYRNQIIFFNTWIARPGRYFGGGLMPSLSLRYAAKRAVRIMPWGGSMLDETGFYAPSVAHNALPGRPWPGISVFLGHNSTVSKQLRYSPARECVCAAGCPALTPLTL